jgi:hypothetical protein
MNYPYWPIFKPALKYSRGQILVGLPPDPDVDHQKIGNLPDFLMLKQEKIEAEIKAHSQRIVGAPRIENGILQVGDCNYPLENFSGLVVTNLHIKWENNVWRLQSSRPLQWWIQAVFQSALTGNIAFNLVVLSEGLPAPEVFCHKRMPFKDLYFQGQGVYQLTPRSQLIKVRIITVEPNSNTGTQRHLEWRSQE